MSTSELSSALAAFFTATWPHDAPAKEPGDLADTAWSEFMNLGLHTVGIDEEAGGSGGTFSDLMAIAALAGRHAADIPAIESATAAWALVRAGLPVDGSASYSIPLGSSTLTVNEDDTVSGTVAEVPWGGSVDQVVTFTDDGRTVAFRPGDAIVDRDRDLAGQSRDTLALYSVPIIAIASGATPDEWRWRAAALRIAQLAGALQATAELTLRYVGERVQFGKPIGTFQAVQAHIVELQQMAVMTTSLADRLAIQPELADFEVTAALIVASENALTAATAAHQAHGAIGMTREYRLHLLTRRLHTWSGDFGEALDLSARLGSAATGAHSFARLIFDDQKTEVPS